MAHPKKRKVIQHSAVRADLRTPKYQMKLCSDKTKTIPRKVKHKKLPVYPSIAGQCFGKPGASGQNLQNPAPKGSR
jgi:hypothetical protein